MKNKTAGRAGRRGVAAARVAGALRRGRRDLLATTALQATAVLLLAFPAAAQPASTARPTGGTLAVGQASISQSTTLTTVQQATQRAAINWNSFDVGSGHTVQYQQPNAAAIVLNRVTGPDPSQIAGRIQANGKVVITNQSGVTFYRGSQVDVQSLIVSSAGVTNENFRAGKMIFDQGGRPDAKISNAGSITVAATGLAALVAPQVANSGVIAAKMGHVVLAGAEAHTVDLYGDGLMSVDVTRDVRRAPGGATALVTNTGTVVADGGTVLLTARAADGIMTNLVSNRGRVQANTAEGKTGTVMMSAVGGSISIEGAVVADGRGPGAPAGTVVLNATGTVALASGAQVSASGQGGGGTVAVGTTVARARAQGGGIPGDAARNVVVAEGARIAADGRGGGSGGTVALVATHTTTMAGRITARGGKAGGDGGRVEVSGQTLKLTGSVDTKAPKGRVGTMTLDPATLTIGDTETDTPAPPPAVDNVNSGDATNISATTFNALAASNDIAMSADTLITLRGGTVLGNSGHIIAFTAGVAGGTASTINVNVGLIGSSIILQNAGSVGGTINITAPVTASTGSAIIGIAGQTSAVNISAAVQASAGALGVSGDAITLGATGSLSAATTMTLVAGVGGIQLQGGNVKAGVAVGFQDAAGTVVMSGGNVVAPLVSFDGGLNISGGQLSATNLTLPSLALSGTGTVWTGSNFSTTAGNGGALTGGTLASSGSITLNGVTSLAGSIRADGDITLNGPAGTPMTLAATVTTPGALTIQQGVAGNGGTGGGITQTGGALTGGTTVLISAADGSAVQSGGTLSSNVVRVVSLPTSGTANTFAASVKPAVTGTVGAPGTAFASPVPGAPGALTVTANGRPALVRLDGATVAPGAALAGDTVELHALGGIVTSNGITAGVLQGTAGYGFPADGSIFPYPFDTAAGLRTYNRTPTGTPGNVVIFGTNAIGTLGRFDAAGAFALTNGTALSVTGPVTATGAVTLGNAAGSVNVSGNVTGQGVAITGTTLTVSSTVNAGGQTLALQADTLSAGSGTFVNGGGTTAYAPLTPGTAVTVDGASLAKLGPAGATAPARLNIGSIAATPTLATTTAGNVTLALGGGATVNAGVLGLYGTGDITQTGGPLTVGTLTGLAGGSATLGNASNAINTLAGFGTVGGLTVTSTAAQLTVTGAATASGAGAAVNLTGAGVFVTTGGSVTSTDLGGTVSLTGNTNGVTLSGGDVRAGSNVTVNSNAAQSSGTVAAQIVTFGGPSLTQSGGTLAGNTVSIATLLQTGPGLIWTTNAFTTSAPTVAGTIASHGTVTLNGVTTLSGSVLSDAGVAINTPASTVLALSGTVVGTGNVSVIQGAFGSAGGSGGGISQTGTSAVSAGGNLLVYAADGALQQASTATLRGTQVRLISVPGVNQAGAAAQASLTGAVGTPTSFGSGSLGPAPSLSASNAAARPTLLRIDGDSIATARALAGDTVELHSIGNTAATGAVTAGLLIGTAGYQTGPSSAPFDQTAGLRTYGTTATVAGATATVGTSSGGAITNIGPYRVAGDATFGSGSGTTNLAGAIDVGSTHTLTLNAAGLSQASAGVITAGTLAGTVTGATDLSTAANVIADLGAFTNTGGAFALNDTIGLRVAGALNAGTNTVTLTVPTLSQTSAGVITAGTLTGTVTGTVDLSTATNAIRGLGPFTVGAGDLVLNDTGTALTLRGGLNLGTRTFSVTAAGLDQTAAGALTAGLLTGTVTGITDLSAATNAVARLSFTNTGGNFTLNDTGTALSIVGLNAGTNTATLRAASLSQTGVITAGTLAGTVAGTTMLTAANVITNLGTFTNTGGSFTLNDTVGLTVRGALNAGTQTVNLTLPSLSQDAAGAITAGRLNGTVTGITDLSAATNAVASLSFTNTGGNFTLNDTGTALSIVGLNAGANTATLLAASLSQTGVITAGTLAGTVTGTTTLTAANAISNLGMFTNTGGMFTLNDTVGLTVVGALNAGVQTVDVTLPSLSQTAAGVITAGLLSGTVAGVTDLSAATNAVASLSFTNTGGNFTLNDGTTALSIVGLNAGTRTASLTAGSLSQTGAITAGTLTGFVSGTTTLGAANVVANLGTFTNQGGNFRFNDTTGLTITGALDAGANRVTLTVPNLSQNSAGVVTAGLLTGTVAGTTDLTAAANAIAGLGPFTNTGGNFALRDGAALTIQGRLDAGTHVVNLVTATVSQLPAGVIVADTLVGSGAGTTDLTGATNQILKLGAYTANGDFRLRDGTGLQVTGALNAGANTVQLLDMPTLTQTAAGVITAGTLTGTVGGVTDLTTAFNAISGIGPFTNTGGNFSLNDGATALEVRGALNAGGNTVAITAGALSQTAAGVITAGTLRLNVASGSLDTAVNQISVLGSVTATSGDFRLNNGPNLTVLGPVVATSGDVVVTDLGTITVPASVAAAVINGRRVVLTATGMAISGNIGACVVGGVGGDIALTANVGGIVIDSGAVVGGQASVALSSITGVSVSGALVNAPTVTVSGDLSIANTGRVVGTTVTVTGRVTVADGTLTAGTLNAGTLSFGGASSISSAGDLSAELTTDLTGTITSGGNLTLTSAGNLTSSGTAVALGAFTLSTGGSFTQTAGILAGNALTITSGGVVNQVNGLLAANTVIQVVGNGTTGTAQLSGGISAPSLQVAEPGVPLILTPASMTGAPASLALTQNNYTFICPGCSASPTVTLGVTPVVTAGTGRMASVLADGSTLTLGATGSTLSAVAMEFHSSGDTTAPARLVADSLTGTAGYRSAGTTAGGLPSYATLDATTAVAGTASFTTATNDIAAVNSYQALNGFTLVDTPAAGLTLTGTVRAGLASDPLQATVGSAAPVSITVNGASGTLAIGSSSAPANLAGSTVTLTANGAITETAGSVVTAATLTGAAPSAAFAGANQVATLSSFTAPGGFSLVNSRNLAVAGPVTAASGTVRITTQDGTGTPSVAEGQSAGTLTVLAGSAPATINGQRVVLSATSMTILGTIGACVVGDISATASGTILVAGTGQVSGQNSVGLAALGGVTVDGIVDAPAVSVSGGLAVGATGQVFGTAVGVTGGATVNGGVLHATMLNAGTVTFNGGDLYAGNSVAITVPATLTGRVASGLDLTVNGAAVSSSATLVAGRALTIGGSGDMQQVSGLFAGASSVSVASTGGVVGQAAAGRIVSGGPVRLGAGGSGAASILGTISAPVVQISEPGVTLTVTPTLTGAGTVSVSGLANVFHCPGCDSNTASSSFTTVGTAGTGSPTTLRIDGGALALGALSASSIELHSVGSTSGNGVITTASLKGTAGYGVAGTGADGLPLFTPSAANAGTGSATFGAANAVASIDGYVTRDAFTFVDAGVPALRLTGTVRAGLVSDPLGPNMPNAAPVTITVAGALNIGDAANPGAVLAGSTVTLNTTGAITELASTVAATALTGSAASVNLPGLNAVASVAGFTAPGGFLLSDGATALAITGPLNAGAGTVTLTAGSLSQTAAGVVTAGLLTGSTTGTVNLLGASNAIAQLGPFANTGGSFGLNDGTALSIVGALNAAANAVTLNAASLSQTTAGVITAGSLSGTVAGATDLSAAANAITALGPFTNTGGAFALNDVAGLTVNGALNAGANTVTLTLPNLRQTAAGVITAGNLRGTVAGTTDLTAAVNAIATLGPFTNTGGGFALNDGAAALRLTGAVNAGGNAVSFTAGSLSQTAAGGLTAGVLGGAVAGVTDLGAGANAVRNIGDFAGGGNFTLADGTTPLNVLGRLDVGSNLVTLTASLITESAGGQIVAGGLTGASAGAVTLGSQNTIQTLGAFVAGGTFTLNDLGTGLVLTGPLSVGPNTVSITTQTLSQTASGVITAGTLTGTTVSTTDLTAAANAIGALGPYLVGAGDFRLNDGTQNLRLVGNLSAGAGGVQISAGSLVETGGLITTQTLTGSTAGDALLNLGGNTVIRLGDFTAGGRFALVDQGDLIVGGTVRAGGVAPALSLQAGGALIIDGGTVSAATVALQAGGAVTERNNGAIDAGTLTVGGSQFDAVSARNTIGALGAVTAPGGVRLVDSIALTVLGPLQAAAGDVSLISAGGIAVPGTLAVGGAVALTAQSGDIVVSNAFTSGGNATLTAQAGSVSVAGGFSTGGVAALTARVGSVSVSNGLTAQGDANLLAGTGVTLQQGSTVASGSTLTLAGIGTTDTLLLPTGTVTMAGAVNAPRIRVAASEVNLRGGTIAVGGVRQPPATKVDALPTVGSGQPGIYFEVGRALTQTGTTTIQPRAGTSDGTARIDLADNGTVSFAQLNAPRTNVILDVGSGRVTGGPIDVQNLFVIFGGTFTSGTVDITGTVAGQSGQAAAGVSQIAPSATSNFRINSCAIASVNCVVLRPQALPIGNPLKELSLSFFREQDDDSELVVPNITEQGL